MVLRPSVRVRLHYFNAEAMDSACASDRPSMDYADMTIWCDDELSEYCATKLRKIRKAPQSTKTPNKPSPTKQASREQPCTIPFLPFFLPTPYQTKLNKP